MTRMTRVTANQTWLNWMIFVVAFEEYKYSFCYLGDEYGRRRC